MKKVTLRLLEETEKWFTIWANKIFQENYIEDKIQNFFDIAQKAMQE